MNKRRIHSSIIKFIATAVLTFPVGLLSQTNVATVVSGTFTYTHYGLNTNIVEHATEGDFRIWLAGDRWLIRTSRLDEPGFLYKEVGTDEDGQVFILFQLRENRGTINQQAAVIEPNINGLAPHSMPGMILWLAYASAQHLAEQRPLKPFFITDDASNYMRYQQIPYTVHIETNKMAPFLPTSATFLEDGIRRFWKDPDQDPLVLPFKTEPRPKPFQKGFTNSVFQVAQWHLRSDRALPEEFHYIRFSPMPSTRDRKALQLGMITSYRFIAKSFEESSMPKNWMPQISGNIRVSDNRFTVDPTPVYRVGYLVNNGIWPDKQDVRRSAAYASRVRSQQIQQANVLDKNSRADRNWITRTAGIALAIGVTTVFFCWYRRLKKQSTTT
jgi:hypothetical protein